MDARGGRRGEGKDAGDGVEDPLLQLEDYFDELELLFADLRSMGGREEGLGVVSNSSERAKYEAILSSTQRLLEIIRFEIFYMDSKPNKYGHFQRYEAYREEYSQFLSASDTIGTTFAGGGSSRGHKVGSLDSADSPPLGTEGVSEGGIRGRRDSVDLSASVANSLEYLEQGRRLLEETNQHGQQVLLSLNTQREQLKEAERRTDAISHTLEDSSLILDKMARWWHSLI